MVIKDSILLIENEKAYLRLISGMLERGGYRVLHAQSGEEALMIIGSHCPKLVILDTDLPDTNGLEFLRRLRSRSAIPVLIISAHRAEQDKVQALDSGADDYICKPFGTEEFMARIRAALRHFRGLDLNEHIAAKGLYTVRDLIIDFDSHQITVSGRKVRLTGIEYRIVELLGRYGGKVLPYPFIIKEIWGPGAGTGNQLLRVNMTNIRHKIEPDPANPRYLFTEAGVGYCLAGE